MSKKTAITVGVGVISLIIGAYLMCGCAFLKRTFGVDVTGTNTVVVTPTKPTP